MARDPTVLNKFRAGFTECATEVSRYVNKIELDNGTKQRLINHLTGCVTSINTVSNPTGHSAFPGMLPGVGGRDGQPQLQVHIPMGASLNGGMFPSSADGAMNLTTASDVNNNHRRSGPESKLTTHTPPPSGSSQFSFQFPPSGAHSPITPTTPSTPRNLSIAVSPSAFHTGPASLSSGYSSFAYPSPTASHRYQPYHRREQLGSVSPCSRSSLGSMSPGSDASSNDVDVEHDIKREQEESGDVWRPW